MKKRKTVFIGLSGGVDSAVSAILLKKNGYDVVGVFIRTWHPDFIKCNEEKERLDAMRISAQLDIPFLTFDLSDVYKKEIADYMIEEYKKGRTPNPDVMCNKQIKFGAFFKKAISMGADYIATGHYAINNYELKIKNYTLKKGIDNTKDQSYFLWTLTQKQLSKVLFPIGHLKKNEVRKLAKKNKLFVSEKKDSQGICFLGDIDLKNFLKHYIKEKKGYVLNEDKEVIGYHEGVFFYTLGERHGFVITKKTSSDKPYYVVGKDIKKNILIVSQNKNKIQESFFIESLSGLASPALTLGSSVCERLSKEDSCVLFSLSLKDVNWISFIPEINKKYTAQIRYHGEFLSCKIACARQDLAQAEVIFEKPVLVAPGQSIVIYEDDICLGGGIVI